MNPPKTKQAKTYLRSSKDRSDVSIEAQRHELAKLAADQGLELIGEFVDVVESGKDEDRAGFIQLYDELRARDRTWSTLIVFDTSRIARRRYTAVNFEHECKRRGVQVLYKSMSGIDPETEILIMSVFQGMDEWHSVISKRKARSGMATNVRRGFRAGGRAPLGYKLLHIDTGVMREGRPVMKSRLEVDPSTAPAVQKYLQSRAAGVRRLVACADAGLNTIAKSSLVGVEWNALTYAGSTIWNVNQEREGGSYVGGVKRRPRAEWEVNKGTHDALITEDQAEQILAQLATYNVRRTRHKAAGYLLSGILQTAAGAPWKGQDDGRYYRTGTRRMIAADVDATVLEKVAEDLRSHAFAQRMLERIKASAGGAELAEAAKLKRSADAIAGRISRFMDMAANLDAPGPVLRKIDELERDRVRIEKQVEDLQREAVAAQAARSMTEASISERLDDLAHGMIGYDRERLKDFLATILDSITLEPGAEELSLNYKIALRSPVLRSSNRGDANLRPLAPTGRVTTYARLKRAA